MPDALDMATIEAHLQTLDGWSLEDGKLRRQYEFDGFSAAFGFVCRVALLCEKQNHHPRTCHSYATVLIETWSHDAGGVTERDVKLAQAIQAL